MDIHIEPGDAGLVVDVLLESRRQQTGIMNLMHTTDAEKELAQLKADAATRTIESIRDELRRQA